MGSPVEKSLHNFVATNVLNSIYIFFISSSNLICGSKHVVKVKKMANWGHCSATCPFREPSTLKQFGGSDETPLSDHLPRGFPLYSAVWTETGADCCDLMLKLRHSCRPTGQHIPAWLLMVRVGDVATRKLYILNCHSWYLQSDNLPRSQMSCYTNTHTHT